MNVLEKCRPWIEAALEYSGGTYEFRDVAQGIYEGKMQLWPADDGCLVTEIIKFPRKRVLNIFLGGGNMHRLADMHDDVVTFAKEQGCDCAMLSGRKGWERVGKQFGWTPLHTTMVREFD